MKNQEKNFLRISPELSVVNGKPYCSIIGAAKLVGVPKQDIEWHLSAASRPQDPHPEQAQHYNNSKLAHLLVGHYTPSKIERFFQRGIPQKALALIIYHYATYAHSLVAEQSLLAFVDCSLSKLMKRYAAN